MYRKRPRKDSLDIVTPVAGMEPDVVKVSGIAKEAGTVKVVDIVTTVGIERDIGRATDLVKLYHVAGGSVYPGKGSTHKEVHLGNTARLTVSSKPPHQ